MNYKRYDIVILPPQEIADQAISISQALAPLDSFYMLDGETLYPHLSLYHVPFAESALPAVRDALRKLADSTASFQLQHQNYYPDQGMWVGVRYVTNQAILGLHTAVITATRDYRIVEDDARYFSRWSELSPKQQHNLKECGWKDAYTLYSPHLSFTKLKQPRADVLALLPGQDLSFLVDHIALCELGDHGTCVKIVADCKLAPERAKPPRPFQQ